MLSSLGLVEALDLRNNRLAIRSSRDYQVGQTTKVRIQIPPGSGKLLTVEVEVIERIPQGKGFIFKTRLLTELKGLEFRGSDPALRERPRYAVNVRVRSRELPGFKATAIDFSTTGTQLILEDAVAVGTTTELHFDLEGFRLSTLSVPAQAMWCTPKADRPNAGFRFLDLSPQLQRDVAELANFLGDRANSDLENLLEQAKLLAPDASVQPLRPRPQPVAAAPQAAPTPPEPEVAWATLPLRARVDGYTRNLNTGSLYLRLASQGQDVHMLEFPDCECLQERQLSACADVVGLSSARQSPWLSSLEARLGPGSWKHYRLLAEDGSVLLELISRPCRAG